jgi:hypothetical protein
MTGSASNAGSSSSEEGTVDTMKFSREYTKLQDRLFTTIRDHSFYNEGQVIDCETPTGAFPARVLLKVAIRFRNIPEALLQYDTDSPGLSAAECREHIRSLYHRDPPGDDYIMTVYLLEKLPEASG